MVPLAFSETKYIQEWMVRTLSSIQIVLACIAKLVCCHKLSVRGNYCTGETLIHAGGSKLILGFGG
ncbi:Uncharacterised protein [Vibrio cincinnatiensis]|uniref:Uncharacterized protein n=1 Tax=Vibrio cincinnatiensis DSM 19608 TaxID=1123491 RepID=A0A1T4NVA1_VIBCI|nr:hypothetical protein SAMN02745782_01481 [Vibrio cincinnatiensis DSM 19608]SUP05506.1 Uncharacterised protein [Vibrio cincinnatiensis]